MHVTSINLRVLLKDYKINWKVWFYEERKHCYCKISCSASCKFKESIRYPCGGGGVFSCQWHKYTFCIILHIFILNCSLETHHVLENESNLNIFRWSVFQFSIKMSDAKDKANRWNYNHSLALDNNKKSQVQLNSVPISFPYNHSLQNCKNKVL